MNDVAALPEQSSVKPAGRKPMPGGVIMQVRNAPRAEPSRYGEWFYGEKSAARKKLKPITNEMNDEEVAAATKENLALIGTETAQRIIAKLPKGHNLYQAVRTSTLKAAPHLGACKFGEIITDYDHEKYDLMQVFLANFSGHLDTSKTARFLTPMNRNYDQMFFGLHVQVDRAGNPLGFNQSLGSNGIAFQTKNLLSAFYHVAVASTGLPSELVKTGRTAR